MEESNKSSFNRKYIGFIDGTIIALFVSAALFSLSYAYNGGYNYYFGIPQMFTNSSWGGIVYRMPQISEIILFLSALSTVIVFISKYLQYRKNIANEKETPLKINDLVYFLIFSVIITIYDAYQFILSGTVLLLSTLILMISITLYMISNIIKVTKLKNELKKLGIDLKKGIDSGALEGVNPKDLKRLREESHRFLDFMKLRPTFKFVLFSCALAFYAFMFILVFIWGRSFAEKQTTFYCIDENSIVTSTYGTNVLVASIDYNTDDKQYFVTGEYSLIPQENLHLSIKRLGPIETRVKQDEIQIAFNLFK